MAPFARARYRQGMVRPGYFVVVALLLSSSGPAHTLRGVVLDDRGEPVVGARLLARPQAPRKNPHPGFGDSLVKGAIVIRGLDAGLHELVVDAPGFLEAAVVVQVPGTVAPGKYLLDLSADWLPGFPAFQTPSER